MKGDRNMIRTVIRGRDFSGVHDTYCRCRGCKPRHPADASIHPAAVIVGLGLLVLAIAVTL